MAAAITNRLGRCEVCDDNDAKYACPRCEVKACCLTCVQIHKKELSCSGERDKVAYKPLKNFTNMDLQSDYILLEEMGRRIQTFARDPCRFYTRQCNLPVHLYRLRRAASERMFHLDFLPHNFSRNKLNTTYFNWKTKVISWHVEWVFPQGNNITCTDDRLPEDERLATLVSKYLDPMKCEELLREHLQFYHSQGMSGVVILLKTERPLRFHELDPCASLKSNLRGKYIIEFPTIYVVLKDHKHMYNVIDSDDEDESLIHRKRRFNGYIKRERSGSTQDNDNFLFYQSDSDKSDAEQGQTRRHVER